MTSVPITTNEELDMARKKKEQKPRPTAAEQLNGILEHLRNSDSPIVAEWAKKFPDADEKETQEKPNNEMDNDIKEMELPDDQMLNRLSGKIVNKNQHYGWVTIDSPGTFMMVPKNLISVDSGYQRTNSVNQQRVLRIASRFSWKKFGVISLSQRTDESYWAFDGQHRYLGAMRRTDITHLPCMIFSVKTIAEEAGCFLASNADRSSVMTIDKISALRSEEDETAIRLIKMLQDTGYSLGNKGLKYTVRCAGALYRAVQSDFLAASIAWKICVDIYNGHSPVDYVFTGLFEIQRQMTKRGIETLQDHKFLKVIVRIGSEKLAQVSLNNVRSTGKGGPRVYGEGIAKEINRRNEKSGNFVPSMALGDSI